jgi:hypothetical protein
VFLEDTGVDTPQAKRFATIRHSVFLFINSNNVIYLDSLTVDSLIVSDNSKFMLYSAVADTVVER